MLEINHLLALYFWYFVFETSLQMTYLTECRIVYYDTLI